MVIFGYHVTVLGPEKRSAKGLVDSAFWSTPRSGRLRVLVDSAYWSVTTVIGSGDSSYVTSPGGYLDSWLMALFGAAIVATLTAAIVGFAVDFLLKQGQGMGASSPHACSPGPRRNPARPFWSPVRPPGGDGSQPSQVELPDDYADLDLDDLSSRLRRQWAPSRRAATSASARATSTTSASGTDSRGACASRTSPGP